MKDNNNVDWQQIVASVTAEYQNLPVTEKQWIAERLSIIEALQQQLDDMFVAVSGEELCARCLGACCGSGRYHLTLVNLLSCLATGTVPEPDFSQDCPFMARHGCQLTVGCRPYNCVTFICDIIEDQMSREQYERFYETERQLRKLYLAFAKRYQGAALTGLLLCYQRLNGRSFFSPSFS